MVPLAYSRIARHMQTLSILWIVFAIYTVLTWLLILPFLHMAFGHGAWMQGSDTWVIAPFHAGGWLLHFIAILVFGRAILSLAVGFALLTRQPWGRIFAIIVAVLTLDQAVSGDDPGDLYPVGAAGEFGRPELRPIVRGTPRISGPTGSASVLRVEPGVTSAENSRQPMAVRPTR